MKHTLLFNQCFDQHVDGFLKGRRPLHIATFKNDLHSIVCGFFVRYAIQVRQRLRSWNREASEAGKHPNCERAPRSPKPRVPYGSGGSHWDAGHALHNRQEDDTHPKMRMAMWRERLRTPESIKTSVPLLQRAGKRESYKVKGFTNKFDNVHLGTWVAMHTCRMRLVASATYSSFASLCSKKDSKLRLCLGGCLSTEGSLTCERRTHTCGPALARAALQTLPGRKRTVATRRELEQGRVVRISLCGACLPNRKRTGLFGEDVARCQRIAVSIQVLLEDPYVLGPWRSLACPLPTLLVTAAWVLRYA